MSKQHESELEGGLGGKRHRRETLQIDRRALLDTRFGLTAKNLEDIGKRAVEIATHEDSSTREVNSATRNIMGMLAHLAQQDKQDLGIADQTVSVTTQVAIQITDAIAAARKEMQDDSEYLDGLRAQTGQGNGQPGDLGNGRQQGAMEDGGPPGGGRPGPNGTGKAE